ncbi:hypothetical protein C3H43_01865 [Campylobacter jejuni]|uniref:hypothetical protein n=1 Tax=Campylobacter jejuni TaxID=197 RepID=UPI000F804E30|nr:hypothetical protein [Campylobacter jejuni]RTJ79958.1 hypothetical protein C3H52_02530 [Campylobacter jejuni]RTJ96166.1 hypothetical protein C3H43_01865 [Campylobacter jejuni]
MNEQIKTINKIILNPDEVLTQELEKFLLEEKQNKIEKISFEEKQNKIEKISFEEKQNKIEKFLLEVDHKAINLNPYDKTLLYDINQGHWDIYRDLESDENCIEIPLHKSITARSPLLDVKEGTVAIDFGTKSTVAGLIDEKSHKKLFRIGTGDIKSEQEKNDYENPTIIEFANIENFKKAYYSCNSRPLTFWEDIRVSHAAATNLMEAKNNDFYRFFSNLKQWAGTNDNKFRIKDNYQIYHLEDFTKCQYGDFNPIEVYAYYIGRYINNMTRGIYLDYLLSFPVKYSQAIREKIRESFESGIRKAIPEAVLSSPQYQNKFKVQLSASEPAAYAISALQEYGFYDEKFVDKQIFYGVFDFGGGTTDFDFGVWRGSEKSRYDFDIEHFGAGGDPYLGGENLLEILAYEIFKENKDLMRKENCSFTKPVMVKGFGGDENLIQNSQEARKNTTSLVEAIRVFWENIDSFREEHGETIQENFEINDLKRGGLRIDFINNDGDSINLELKFNVKDLENKLIEFIDKGVESFYHSYKIAAEKMKGIDKLHIFLGGNSSRSPLVKEAFERMIEKRKKESNNALDFELYPPLGTVEAEEKRKKLGLKENTDNDLSTKITCKTGVVFGLLDGRKGSKINVISEVGVDDEAKFNFYLGIEKMKKFKIVIDKNTVDTTSGDWHIILDYADMEDFEIFYTSNATANSNQLDITETKRLPLKLDKPYDDGKICIQITGVNSFKYAVMVEEKKCYESSEIKLSI